jgi:hypothetical protein
VAQTQFYDVGSIERMVPRDPTLNSHKQGDTSGILAPSLLPATRFLICEPRSNLTRIASDTVRMSSGLKRVVTRVRRSNLTW